MNEQQQQLQNFTSLLNQNGVVTAIPQKVVAHKTYVKMVKSNYETAEYEINVNASRKESQEARNETGGKRFSASNELLERKDSISFPSFTAKSLSGRQVNLAEEFPNHMTLLLIAMRGIAQPMNDEYRKAFHAAFSHTTRAKCIEVNVIGSLFYGLFRFFISRKLREKISQDRHDSFLCFYGSFEKLTSSDLIGNTIVGHAFLIDSEGFVRWKACAKPTKDELESMIKCCKQLLP